MPHAPRPSAPNDVTAPSDRARPSRRTFVKALASLPLIGAVGPFQVHVRAAALRGPFATDNPVINRARDAALAILKPSAADLELMRGAIDSYKRLCDEKKILEQDVDQRCYPLTLEELVEGVEIHSQDATETKTMRFLRRIPIDPFTGEADWGLRSYQDDWDSTSWGGENVYDVYSTSTLLALDGNTRYNEW